MWYTGTPVFEFGDGLFYTTFKESAAPSPSHSGKDTYDIKVLTSASHPGYDFIEQVPFLNFTATVKNEGKTASPYTCMLFASTKDAGPKPYPNKWLVGFDRLATISPGHSSTLSIPVTLGSVARVDENGNRILYPGKYELALNNNRSVVVQFELTGEAAALEIWPAA
jgi:beta-D-xylosidase 4